MCLQALTFCTHSNLLTRWRVSNTDFVILCTSVKYETGTHKLTRSLHSSSFSRCTFASQFHCKITTYSQTFCTTLHFPFAFFVGFQMNFCFFVNTKKSQDFYSLSYKNWWTCVSDVRAECCHTEGCTRHGPTH